MLLRGTLLLSVAACALSCAPDESAEQPATADPDAAVEMGQPVGHDGDVSSDASTPPDTGPAVDAAPDAVPDVGPDATSMNDAAPEPMGFRLTSTAFADGDPIPARHTCFGEDLQPPLEWFDAPARTKSFAVVLIDESFDFVHYIAHDIPFDVTALPEGASDEGGLPEPAREVDAYGGGPFHGPCPPEGPNTYAFRVYALDRREVEFAASGRLSDADLESAFGPHSLGMAVMRGTAFRP